MLRRLTVCAALFALLPHGGDLRSEALDAAAVAGAARTDFVALARVQKSARAGSSVPFVWESYPAVGYDEIRRSLWLAALHGITNHVCRDERTRRLLRDERLRAGLRCQTPFAFDVAIRDVPSADRLYRKLLAAQTSCTLVDADGEASFPMTLRCQGDEVLNESSGIVFTSREIAVSFAQACHAARGLVFDGDGGLAKDIFIRHFADRSVTVVNLTRRPRPGLLYRRGLLRQTFDLPPAGVVHLTGADAPRFSRDSREPFGCSLWRVSCEGRTTRLVDSQRLPTVVDEGTFGTIVYRTNAFIPTGEEALLLHLKTGGSETAVSLGGNPLGVRIWEPFEWDVPLNCRGKSVPLEIKIEKKTATGLLLDVPTWRRR